ncbi:MAG: hypothetical protein AB7O59_01045 [Pirellulales bacterium]
MGTVETKFTSDATQLERAYDKLYRDNVRMKQSMADVGRESKKQHGEVMGYLTSQTNAIKGLALGFASAGTAVGLVTSAVSEARQEMAELVAKTRDAQKEFAALAIASGNASRAGELEQKLRAIGGMTAEQKLTAYGAAAATGGSLDANLEIVKALAPLAASGKAPELAGVAGQMGDLTNLSPAQRANLATYLSEELRGNRDQLTAIKSTGAMRRLIDSGAVDAFSAIGMEMAAVKDANRPGLPAAFAAAVDRTYEAPKLKGRTKLTADELGQSRLAAAKDANERVRLILNDEAAGRYALPNEYDAMQRLLPLGQARTAALKKNYGTAISRSAAGLQTSGAARETEAIQFLSVEQEVGEEDRAARGRRLERAQQALDAAQNRRGMGGFNKAVGRMEFWFNRQLMRAVGSGSDPMLDALSITGSEGPAAMQGFTRAENIAKGFGMYDSEGRLTKQGMRDEYDARTVQERQLDVLRNIERTIEQGNRERRSDRRGSVVRDINEK